MSQQSIFVSKQSLALDGVFMSWQSIPVRPEKFQFLEKWKNRNFGYKIVILVKILKFIL